ncbi:MAG TPA: cellulase family glycosylhydrolase [Abditibacteriaceae bacterium]|jgi:hypothetical protein
MAMEIGWRAFKLWRLLVLLLVGALCSHAELHTAQGAAVGAEVAAIVPLEVGDVVFQTNFEGAEALQPWSEHEANKIRLAPGRNNSQSLTVEAPVAGGAASTMIRVPLPVEKLRGARLKLEAMMKSDNVVQPPQPWNGVKFMLHTVAPDVPRWEQQNNVFGTFDWKPVSFTTRVPKDASEAWLMLGLEATTGQVWFDDIKITVVSVPRIRPAQPAPRRINNEHRLRGAMISPNATADDLRVLGKQWGANHVRWQLTWGGFPQSPADSADEAAYDAWLESVLKHVDELLPLCKELGIAVLIDLHTPPGGRNAANECRMFQEKKWQDKFLGVWDKIARRYRGNETVWGYDLVNEPVEGTVPDDLMNWRALVEQTARRVRAIDAQHAIVVEPAPWGSPSSIEDFEPLPVSNVVYSVHMYEPHQFTHQGVYSDPVGVNYPGTINGRQWDKEQLRRVLQPVIEFQRDYGVPIYIGEFSAIRWAPDDSAYRYLKDAIDIFEENNWSWAYHAFREWNGWSVEHSGNKADNERSATPTTREQLLRAWFAKNAKPNTIAKPAAQPAKK